VSPRPNRRRGLVLLALALASGGLAASQVHERTSAVEARVGPLVPVLAAARDLPPDAPLAADAVVVRKLPARFVPPDALGLGAAGPARRTVVAVPAGTVLTATLLGAGAGRAAGGVLRPGERAVQITAAGGDALASATPGARVDVLVSRESGAGGSTVMALEDVELLALRATGTGPLDPDDAGTGASGDTAATLRVTPRQAVYLTAAQSFARELRLLLRPPGDRRRNGALEVGAGAL
jgi:pilus assembly protein CpaB